MSGRAFGLTLAVLMTAATLFPPFNWGEERLTTVGERALFRETLPVKGYAFIFGASSRIVSLPWGWDEQQRRSVPRRPRLQRHLITSELLLEYVLILIASAVVSQFASGARLRPRRKAGHAGQSAAP
jgi:hypothetical protein